MTKLLIQPQDRVGLRQVQEFSRRGFLIIDDFLDLQLVQELVRAVESLTPDERASRVRRGVAFARRNLLELDFVRTLIAQARVRSLIDAFEPDSVAVRAILFDKNESANWTVPWHQDRSIAVRERVDIRGFGPWSIKAGIVHVQPPLEILRRMLTLRVQLDPCGNGNGPLRVIAATHDRILEQREIESAIRNSAQATCVTNAGGLIVMRPLTLHASSPAVNPSHRRVIHIEFGPSALPGGVHWAMV
jgi:Phytanoyl-CoA dioxygenase (PhyH)